MQHFVKQYAMENIIMNSWDNKPDLLREQMHHKSTMSWQPLHGSQLRPSSEQSSHSVNTQEKLFIKYSGQEANILQILCLQLFYNCYGQWVGVVHNLLLQSQLTRQLLDIQTHIKQYLFVAFLYL